LKNRHLRLKNLLLSSCGPASKIRFNKQETNGPKGRDPEKWATASRSESPHSISRATLFEETSEMQKDTVAAAIGSQRSST